MLKIFFDHPGFCLAFVIVIFAARQITKASVNGISYATVACMIGIIWFTGFPFWPAGETLSEAQLILGSIFSFALIGGLAMLIDQIQPAKSLS